MDEHIGSPLRIFLFSAAGDRIPAKIPGLLYRAINRLMLNPGAIKRSGSTATGRRL